MNFFEAQEKARQSSRRLVIYFALAIAAIVIGINLAAYFVFFAASSQEGMTSAGTPSLFDPGRWLGISAASIALIVGGSLLRTAQLRQGGGYVARSVGGRKIDPGTRSPLEQRLMNVVEEMAIASGVPMPEVYVLDGEAGINAFAAGHSPNDAAVAVTRGTLETLTRDELQGVVAHEFSHILNGDMRINIRMIGVLFGILMIAILGRILLHASAGSGRARSGRDRGGAAIVIFGLAIMVIGFVGEFFGRLIQSALSRQREFLADAAAVQFTRNPEGISGALKTIGGASAKGHIENQQAAGMAHCFFASALSSKLGGALATHPPLPDRIRALEPQWDGRFIDPSEKRRRAAAKQETAEKPKPKKDDTVFRAMSMVAGIGSLDQNNVAAAHSLIEGLPTALRDAAHDPVGATAILLALVLDPSESARLGQLRVVEGAVDKRTFAALQGLLPLIRERSERERLPLAELALPSLQGISAPERMALLTLIDQLVLHDKQVTLFEFCFGALVEHRLRGERAAEKRSGSLPDAVGRLLSKVVSLGSSDPDDLQRAFSQSLVPLQGRIATPAFFPPESVSPEVLKEDLAALRRAYLPLRKAFLEACEIAIRRDQSVSTAEADLFRAIAVCIDCPAPLVG